MAFIVENGLQGLLPVAFHVWIQPASDSRLTNRRRTNSLAFLVEPLLSSLPGDTYAAPLAGAIATTAALGSVLSSQPQ